MSTETWDEERVWKALQGRRFHKLANPNPMEPGDVTSTWTIPAAGKDELILNDDGTYVFAGSVHFVDGHVLLREGRGAWVLEQRTVVEGDWIALHVARLLGIQAHEVAGRTLWQVTISGPDLTQTGEAMDLDDVNECGVFTQFAEANATDDDTSTKRIRQMSWWVDDLLTWNNQVWLSPDEQRLKDRQKRNPRFAGLSKGFLNIKQNATERLEFTRFDASEDRSDKPQVVASAVDESHPAGVNLMQRRKSKLPPLVPQRSDLTQQQRAKRPPHVYCGMRIEDIAIGVMMIGIVALVVWQNSYA